VFNELAKDIHTKDNHKWWHTPEGVRLERNKGELIALIHSELSEAWEAVQTHAMDDKLPARRGEEVELADYAIRVLDYAGAYGLELDTGECFQLPGLVLNIASLHFATSRLLEAVRKGQPEDAHVRTMLRGAFDLAQHWDFDLEATILEKRSYNAIRKDHTHEARAQPGGKAF
jgi:hypothetical protein